VSDPDELLRQTVDELTAPLRKAHSDRLVGSLDDTFVVSQAERCYVWDQYRSEYLDFSCEHLVLGHSDDGARSALNEQLLHYGNVSAPGDFAERMVTEYADALACSLPDGDELQVLFTTDTDEAALAAHELATWVHGENFTTVRLVRAPGGEMYTPDEIASVVRDARDMEVGVIIDETRTGFGRTGHFWAQTRWGVTGDITVVGGPAGAGFPFGAVVAPRSYWEKAAPRLDRYAAHPAICAAGLSVMRRVANEDFLNNVVASGEVLHEALNGLEKQFPDVVDTHRGVGLLHTLVCTDAQAAKSLARAAKDNGLLLSSPGGTRCIRLTPPLNISTREILRGVDILGTACLDIAPAT
jgi:acetylornithine/succinyldiaminopimelate/putrescine aminotransferase